ncbi:MAG: hypothetical protein ABWZ52_09240 [Acidimicrobiales bacterium]
MTATTPTTAGELAARLLELVERQLAHLATGPLPAFDLPRVLMAEPVGQDVRADLLFTLGLLHQAGRTEVAGVGITDAIERLLARVDGGAVDTFYSYRVAETVARFGGIDDRNRVVAALDDGQRASVAEAADSASWVELLDTGLLPRNYAAVLARCEAARDQLGLLDDRAGLEDLLARVRGLLGGHLDDSNTAIGRYDLYTVDLHLFCEPLADRLGAGWVEGTRRALQLVDTVATTDGSAVPWGRSTGALAVCHTIELAGLVCRHDLVEDRGRWLARAAHATAHVGRWFRDGWVTAHQHRAADPYRGLDRRLQMTLDCLGKLVDTAVGLQHRPDEPVPSTDLFPPRDEVVWFDDERTRGVWAFRDKAIAFALPLVGGTTTEYLPGPRNPGLFEVPVASDLATGTPLVVHGGKRFAVGGGPTMIRHDPGTVTARYEGIPRAGHLEPGPDSPALGGHATITWRVDGRSIVGVAELELEEAPGAIALQVAEAPDRPLRLEAAADGPHALATVPVDGIAEYRSTYGELPVVHQVDVEPSPRVTLRWRVTPKLRIASTSRGHLYNDSLYAPLADRVRVEGVPESLAWNARERAHFARRVDQLHLHWPEWTLMAAGPDLGAHRGFIAGLRQEGTRIVWTMHNLVPHAKDPAFGPIYEAWAAAADLVLHHSEWGRDRALAAYRFGATCRHVVIPHAAWGTLDDERADDDRAATEEELGLRPGALRLGVVGAARDEKDAGLVMRAVARSAREDLELVVLSMDVRDDVPVDRRIVARRYELVDRATYERRLHAFDALVMPFDPDGDMLATGTVGDAVAAGLPVLASEWPFLAEALGDAALTYGRTEDDLLATLETLDRAELARAAGGARALREPLAWATIAERTYEELDRLGTPHL